MASAQAPFYSCYFNLQDSEYEDVEEDEEEKEHSAKIKIRLWTTFEDLAATLPAGSREHRIGLAETVATEEGLISELTTQLSELGIEEDRGAYQFCLPEGEWGSTWTLMTALTELEVPEGCQARMIALLMHYVNVNVVVLPATVVMDIVEPRSASGDEWDVEEAVRRSVEEETVTMVPASEAAIAGLEKVEKEETHYCLICLGDDVQELTRLPCSHIFHSECVVTWLRISRFCPRCRFAMPCLGNGVDGTNGE